METVASKSLSLFNYNFHASGNYKSLGTSPNNNSGAVPQTPVQWVEKNQYIWDAIQKGTSGFNPQQIAQFTDWYNYAYSAAFGNGGQGWEPSMDDANLEGQ